MGMNGEQVGSSEVDSTQNQVSPDVPLITEQHLLKQAVGRRYFLLAIRVQSKKNLPFYRKILNILNSLKNTLEVVVDF